MVSQVFRLVNDLEDLYFVGKRVRSALQRQVYDLVGEEVVGELVRKDVLRWKLMK